MFRLFRIGVFLVGIVYCGIMFFDRIWLVAEGDPSTPQGYIRRDIKHGLGVAFGRQDPNDVYLNGYLLNGGDRELRNVEVRVFYAKEHGDTTDFKTVNLGHFDPNQQRKITKKFMLWYEDELWWEVEIVNVDFVPLAGSERYSAQ